MEQDEQPTETRSTAALLLRHRPLHPKGGLITLHMSSDIARIIARGGRTAGFNTAHLSATRPVALGARLFFY
jgi:hypothetical protein